MEEVKEFRNNVSRNMRLTRKKTDNSNYTVDDIGEYYTKDSIEWWKDLDKKEKINSGDIVYLRNNNKFGIFMDARPKEKLCRVWLLKKNSKNAIYSRPWNALFDDIELVKKSGGKAVKKGFKELENKFIKK